jgi:hypothetical protein
VPKGKPQKVAKCGIRREEGFLYFIDKKGNVSKVKMKRTGTRRRKTAARGRTAARRGRRAMGAPRRARAKRRTARRARR